jgi:hypothetical protein
VGIDAYKPVPKDYETRLPEKTGWLRAQGLGQGRATTDVSR